MIAVRSAEFLNSCFNSAALPGSGIPGSELGCVLNGNLPNALSLRAGKLLELSQQRLTQAKSRIQMRDSPLWEILS